MMRLELEHEIFAFAHYDGSAKLVEVGKVSLKTRRRNRVVKPLDALRVRNVKLLPQALVALS